jgi:hypothetical protein
LGIPTRDQFLRSQLLRSIHHRVRMGAGGRGAAPKAIWLSCIFLILPLKIWLDKNLVFPRSPMISLKNERTRHRTWCGEGVYRVVMGAGGQWAALKPIWLSSFFSDSPLKNMMDGNLVFPVPPDDIIKKPAYPTLGSSLSWRNGRWRTMGGGRRRGGRRPWFPCCENIELFQKLAIII